MFKKSQYQLRQVLLTEMESTSGLRIREHTVWSLFEADRKLEAIRQHTQGSLPVVRFDIDYIKAAKPLSYKGIFRFDGVTGSISLQRHIEQFLRQHSNNPEALGLAPEVFERLHANMVGLFDACVTEQMFQINRPSVFVPNA